MVWNKCKNDNDISNTHGFTPARFPIKDVHIVQRCHEIMVEYDNDRQVFSNNFYTDIRYALSDVRPTDRKNRTLASTVHVPRRIIQKHHDKLAVVGVGMILSAVEYSQFGFMSIVLCTHEDTQARRSCSSIAVPKSMIVNPKSNSVQPADMDSGSSGH